MTSALYPTYARADVIFTRGEGPWLFAENGDRYLDFASGVAVLSLGHDHPHLVATLKAAAEKPWHISNLFQIPQAEALARRLVEATFADVVFFCNSGAEAVECAIKTVRKYHAANGQPERYRLITFEGAFHGRTLATIAAGGNPKYLDGFGAPTPGFDQVPFADLEAVEAAITDETAGFLLEPVQGEGGLRVFPREFLLELRKLCDARGLLMALDEVQCGVGRTGKFLACEHAGVAPDVVALAKGLGGGFPIGACLATSEAAKGMTLGTHGSTFGGNPLATAVGGAVLDVVLSEGFLPRVAALGSLLRQRLAELEDRYPKIIETARGEGLMFGVKTRVPNGDFAAAARAEGLLTVLAGDNVVRLLPPLIIDEGHISEAVSRLDKACARLAAPAKQLGAA
ncbi:aspartate aminotransferase family protein [Methylocystis parvus]|uniref:Acetylornithine aminotransferase n=1 Tax=Methylocystis parvus TaxID=134 RepID=A0A6B8M585_9HYPH|nr:aspartate aminotransferase family protein [Methylocystis parvus]QGM96929.1 aspartate aminotransferase family protein [Methylocystis parvus]WBJ99184.1 aspartate aminotransferase family protein [Methylocystis parvus OBBP]